MKSNSEGKLAALEIEPELHALWDSHPDGLTLAVLIQAFGLPYHTMAAAALELVEAGKARWFRRPDRRPNYLVPPDYHAPEQYDLTTKQRSVFEWMVARCDAGGHLECSFRRICAETMRSKGGIVALIDALDRKGFVKIIERGKGTRVTRYKVYPNGDGPRWE